MRQPCTLIAILLLVSCTGPSDVGSNSLESTLLEAIHMEQLQQRGKKGELLWYAPNQENPFTGSAKSFWSNGQVKQLITFANGLLDGPTIKWLENGQKVEVNPFNRGILHGLATKWHKNGQKLGEGNFVYGENDGTWLTWYENGQLKLKANYKLGKQEGIWTSYYRNGQKEEEANYINGKEEGTLTRWDEHGQKEMEGNYLNGKLDGLLRTWDWNGLIEEDAIYTNGKRAVHYEFKIINGGVGYNPKTTSVFVITADEARNYSKPDSNLNLYAMAAHSIADVKVSEGRIVAITQSHELAEQTLGEKSFSEISNLRDALAYESKKVVIFGEGTGATAKASVGSQNPKKTASQTSGSNANTLPLRYEFKVINGGVGYDPKTTSVYVVTADEARTYSKPNSNLNLYGMAAHSFADVKVSEGRIVAITQSHEFAERTLREITPSEVTGLQDALSNGSKRVVIFGEGSGATAKVSLVENAEGVSR